MPVLIMPLSLLHTNQLCYLLSGVLSGLNWWN